VILSPSFFRKQWPRRELDGLVAREVGGADRKVILPVWHKVDHDYVARFSPPLADRMAVESTAGIVKIVEQVEYVLRTAASSSVANDGESAPRLPPDDEDHRSPSIRELRCGLQGPVLLEPSVHGDQRGFFIRPEPRARRWIDVRRPPHRCHVGSGAVDPNGLSPSIRG